MKLTIENIKWLIIGALIVYIVLLQQCGGSGATCPEVSVTTKIDTFKIKGKSDTVFVELEKPIYITVGVPTPTTITVPTPDGGTMTVHEYSSEVRDSLIEGTITSRVDGTLLSQDFEYKPLFPKYITRVDTFLVDKTETVVKEKNYISLGGEIGLSATSLNLSPVVSLYTKRGYTYSYRYGLFDQTHNIGIQKRISFKIKNPLKIL